MGPSGPSGPPETRAKTLFATSVTLTPGPMPTKKTAGGGECGYQWGGAVRKMKWNIIEGEREFGCEPCTAGVPLVLPLYRQDGTDIGYNTGYCAPETCKYNCFSGDHLSSYYSGYVSTIGS